jgi:hypothetical protein
MSIPFSNLFSARAKWDMLPHPIMNIDKFFDCVGNLAIDPTIELSASAKTLECLLFVLAIFIFYEKIDYPFFFCANTHLDVVVEIHMPYTTFSNCGL